MAGDEFEAARNEYEAGHLSRRRFVAKLIAGGATAVAAVAFVNSSTAMAAPGSGKLYGTPARGGLPPGLKTKPPGLGGTPPGKGGTPPGRAKRA